MSEIYLLMLSKIKEPMVGDSLRVKVNDFCVSWLIVFLHLSGDQSELHIIIFDEIDAICKVGD